MNTERTTPCSAPDVDPDDWFIGKDGRQYPDDELVSDAEILDHEARLRAALDDVSLSDVDTPSLDEIRIDLEAQALKANLVRRRHAKDKCHVECPVRLQCLSIALGENGTGIPLRGTWGGYYEEELAEIRRLHQARQRRRREE